MNISYTDFSKLKRIHFIGIGGISMSTLAAISEQKGYIVSGSDRKPSELTKKLEKMGIKISFPQRKENLADVEGVVYTAAISKDNEEFAEAVRRNLPMLSRAEYLGGLMQGYNVRIGVSGTHGKSSTTGMLAHVFKKAGKDPTVANGAVLTEFDSAYHLGTGDHFIYEACEYKDSFLHFHPSIAVMLNMEMDHVDYFHSMEQMEQSYVDSAKDCSAVVANFDDPHVRNAAKKIKGAWIVRIGIETKEADYSAKNIRFNAGLASFDLYNESNFICEITLSVPGYHHIYNALSVAAVGLLCGLTGEEIKDGLKDYQGIKRRFEYKGSCNGAAIYDDYAHHPTEIATTIKAAREVLKNKGRLFVAFQPHTYSRTAGLFDEFVKALSLADFLLIAPIYAAREVNTYGISSRQIAEKIENARFLESFEEMAEVLSKELREGDLLLTMGAGEANKTGAILLEKGREII